MSDENVTLYLFRRDFRDQAYPGKQFICPYCLRVEGLLALFPKVRHSIVVKYVDFEKPRGQLPKLAGEDKQSCPQIILSRGDDEHSAKYTVPGLNEVRRIDRTDDILQYFIDRFGLSEIHP